jgi:hypothetical protein
MERWRTWHYMREQTKILGFRCRNAALQFELVFPLMLLLSVFFLGMVRCTYRCQVCNLPHP